MAAAFEVRPLDADEAPVIGAMGWVQAREPTARHQRLVRLVRQGARLWLSGCRIEDMCGNGLLETGEVCDDGNTIDGDGCAANCM